MSTLFVVIVAEILFCLFFKKYAVVLHGALLLFVAKILFPIVKSIVLHVFWRIPMAFIQHRAVATFRAHNWFSLFFGDSYKSVRAKKTPIIRHEKAPLPERVLVRGEMPWVDEVE